MHVELASVQEACIAYQLEALLLEAGNDLRNKTALDAIRLDHDKGAFTGHRILHTNALARAHTHTHNVLITVCPTLQVGNACVPSSTLLEQEIPPRFLSLNVTGTREAKQAAQLCDCTIGISTRTTLDYALSLTHAQLLRR